MSDDPSVILNLHLWRREVPEAVLREKTLAFRVMIDKIAELSNDDQGRFAVVVNQLMSALARCPAGQVTVRLLDEPLDREKCCLQFVIP